MSQALVFSIEEFSTFDGPGIRTTVFLKGCPLACSWCHNPEGQSFENQIMKAQSGCIGCLACLEAGRAETGVPCLTEKSIAVCPNRLLRSAAVLYTPETLAAKLRPNFDILRLSGGGVTFSGGEPLAHPEFLTDCLDRLSGEIHTAVQTSGFASPAVFGRVLERADYFLFDLKLADPALHRRYTGVDNSPILANFRTLAESGKAFTVRTPLIPGVTDTEENLRGIADILKQTGVRRIELLPYNRAAGSKYAAVGRQFTPDYDETRPVNLNTDPFTREGIEARVL